MGNGRSVGNALRGVPAERCLLLRLLRPHRLHFQLVGSAKPNPALGVYEQGAGRVDVAAAVSRQVTADPATVNFGRQLNGAVLSQSVTITTSGLHAATTDSTLAAYSGSTINGLTLSGGPDAINGTNASDNIAVARVDFLVDGQIAGSVTAAPYTFPWNSQSLADGTQT